MVREHSAARTVVEARELSPALLRRRLLHWYRRNHRPLPWRGTRDPYRIWVSEVMLQQTQVATVEPFYQRFLARFPNLEALAAAREADVLATWAGLGYYRRARSLVAAARWVVREHAGRIPDDPDRLGRLPGIGRYTAGAILSIAFDRPLAVLDGNVARVLARLYRVEAAIRDPRGARALWRMAETLVPSKRAGEWNQALMELGATVCLPRAPRCRECPVRMMCRAHARGEVHLYPPAPAPRSVRRRRRAVAVIERRGRLLMVRRQGPMLGGLWEPPGVELRSGSPASRVLAAELRRLGLRVRLVPTGQVIRHRITDSDITAELWKGELTARPRLSATLRPVDPIAPKVAITALARRIGGCLRE